MIERKWQYWKEKLSVSSLHRSKGQLNQRFSRWDYNFFCPHFSPSILFHVYHCR